MFYITLLFILTSYFYILDPYFKIKSPYLFLIYFLPFFFYWFTPAFQEGIGTDYNSYIRVYNSDLNLYIIKGEYLFVYLVKFLNALNFGPQSLFAVMGAIHAGLFILVVNQLRILGFKPWLIVFLFFTVSTIYNNQMSGLRSYVAILAGPLFFIYLYNSKYIKAILLSAFAILFHRIFVLYLMLAPLLYLKYIKRKTLFIFFLISPVIYGFFPKMFVYTVKLLFPFYLFYLDIQFSFQISRIFTNIYFLPLILYFWFLYIKGGYKAKYDERFFNYMIVIFAFTHCAYLADFGISLQGRVMMAYIFFYIFPIYYILHRSIVTKNKYIFVFTLMYAMWPFYVKVFLFPIREYSFNTIIY